ncbi:hypothetical protein Trydic_g2944 [Trypoxylus dichotomus]
MSRFSLGIAVSTADTECEASLPVVNNPPKSGTTVPDEGRFSLIMRFQSGGMEDQRATVPQPITEILGGPDLFINMGSTINLTCHVRYAPEPPPTMSWAHNAQVINFDSPRGGISLVTEKGYVTTSRLLIQKAVQADSGLYTCDPSNANSASVRVHILNGKNRKFRSVLLRVTVKVSRQH